MTVSAIFLLVIFLQADAPEVRGARMPSMDVCRSIMSDVANQAPKGSAVMCIDLGPVDTAVPSREEPRRRDVRG